MNGRLFAVDAPTNLYLNAGGAVKIVSPAGALLSSNLVCPVTMQSPTVAQRDGSGNYWFFGTFDGTNDFGGVILVGGWSNNPTLGGHWTPGYPTCFLASYSSNGVLQFATSFGHQAQQNTNYDLALDPAGGAYVSFHSQDQTSYYSHFSNTGSNDWQITFASAYGSAGTLDGVTASNCCRFEYVSGPFVKAGRLTRTGSYADFTIPEAMGFSSPYAYNGRAVLDDAGRVFQAGICHPSCAGLVILRKVALDNTEAWEVGIGAEEQFTLARDPAGHVYIGGVTGTFSQYSTDGAFIWSTNYSQVITRMLVDNAGTRFLNFADGSLARLADGFSPQLPVITNGPVSQTVFTGDAVSLSVSATGTLPITYDWRLNTLDLGMTSNSLAIPFATTNNAGTYTVVLSNPAGSITSAPAVLRVKQVELYNGSQLLTNGNYAFPIPPTLSVRSAFSGGSIYYSLDGSTPDFSSTPYAGPFVLSNSAVVKAIGYSADFVRSELADSANITVLPYHTLVATSTGGGTVTLNPPGGTYADTNVVTATATPASGWSFLGWQGDASGTMPSVNVSMDRDKTIFAVFGTTLSTSVAGNGQVERDPPAGPYPYGTVVRLTGVPQSGSYFGAWGNAASGNTNPLYFTISAPTQTVSSIFGTLADNQAALTVLITGGGTVAASPRANVFATNQSVVLTATPASGQLFVNWTGDASGTANPLTLAMTQSRVVTANFSPPGLFVNPGVGDGMVSNGFQFTLVSVPQTAWQIFASSNLNTWESLGMITNTQGACHYFDPAGTNPARYYKAVTP